MIHYLACDGSGFTTCVTVFKNYCNGNFGIFIGGEADENTVVGAVLTQLGSTGFGGNGIRRAEEGFVNGTVLGLGCNMPTMRKAGLE